MKEFNLEKEIEKRCKEDPEFRKLFDDSGNYYDLIFEFVGLRKKNEISQGELSRISGVDKSIICRYEKRDHVPNLLNFTKILNAMGYELCIRKKEKLNENI